jgi:hypothetical protein
VVVVDVVVEVGEEVEVKTIVDVGAGERVVEIEER